MSEYGKLIPAQIPTGMPSYSGERVIAKAVINTEEVAERTSAQAWCCLACMSFFPPFLPFLPFFCILTSPCTAKDRTRQRLQGTSLVLTDSAIRYDVAPAPGACCCGLIQEPAVSKTIPLEGITDVQLQYAGQGCCQCWSVSKLEIHTPSDPITGGKHPRREAEITVQGVLEPERFRDLIQEARRGVRGGGGGMYQGSPVVQPRMMMAPEAAPSTTVDHLQALARLRETGALSEAEFAAAKQRVLLGN